MLLRHTPIALQTPPPEVCYVVRKEAVSWTEIWNFCCTYITLQCDGSMVWGPPVWYHEAKLPIAVYNCSQKVLHIFTKLGDWKCGLKSAIHKNAAPNKLCMCPTNTFMFLILPVKTLTEFGVLEQKKRQKKTLPDLWVCESLFLGFLVICPFSSPLRRQPKFSKRTKIVP